MRAAVPVARPTARHITNRCWRSVIWPRPNHWPNRSSSSASSWKWRTPSSGAIWKINSNGPRRPGW
nr:MAG TPA: hypothetical protein [Caudoviricetes sp.]